jgi:hypothetical protein
MIRINVEEYCHQCLDFTPDVIEPTKTYVGNEEIILSDTIVQCKYRKRCSNMFRFLEHQAKDEAVG